MDHNVHKISKTYEWKVFATHLNNFWTLTPNISKSYQHTPSICISILINSRTRNSNLRRKPETEIVLAAILTKNHKNGPKLNFGPLYLTISPRYDIDMCVVFDKVNRSSKFESGGKTGNGSSFVRHFGEKTLKRPKIAGNWSAFRKFKAPSNSGASPARRSDSEYAECMWL